MSRFINIKHQTTQELLLCTSLFVWSIEEDGYIVVLIILVI